MTIEIGDFLDINVNLYLLDYNLNLSYDKSAIIKFLITLWYKKISVI